MKLNPWTIGQRYPRQVIAVTIIITAIMLVGALRIFIVTDLTNFFSQNDPRVQLYNQTLETFGNSNYIIAVVELNEVFSVSGLAALHRLTEAIAEVPGIESVRSLTNIEEVRGTDFGIEVGALMPELPQNEDEVAQFREKVLTDSQYAERLISADGRYAAILIKLSGTGQADDTVPQIRQAISENQGPLVVHLTGTPVLYQEMNSVLRDDLLKLSPAVVLLILFILFLSFRSWQGVVLPLMGMVVSSICCLGLMGYLGVPLTQLSAILPVVFTSVGSAYGIHVLHRYREEVVGAQQSGVAITRTAVSVGPAVLMAGITTIAGFLSNVFNSVIRIREFGLFAAIGIGVALLFSLLVIPAVLALCTPGERTGRPESSKQRQGQSQSNAGNVGNGEHEANPVENPGNPGNHANLSAAQRFSSQALSAIGTFVSQHQRPVVVAITAVVLAAALGLPRLVVDTDFINFFDKQSSTRQAFALVQDHFGGTENLQMVITGDITSPEVLRGMEKAQEQLEKIEHLAHPISIVDIIKRISRELHDGDPVYEHLPDSSQAVAQYLLLLSMSGEDLMSEFLTIDYEQAKIEVLLGKVTAAERNAILRQMEEIAEELRRIPGVEQVDITGMPFMAQAMSDLITKGQLESLVISLVAVFLLVWILVRSVTGAFLCLLPIIATILINFGIMGWLNLPFNVVTALVSSIAIGMGIDYSIHIHTRCYIELKGRQPVAEAIRKAVATTGQAVVLNAGAVALGFLVLIISNFPPLRTFGALIALTMIISAANAITLLPVLIMTRYTKGRSKPASEPANI